MLDNYDLIILPDNFSESEGLDAHRYFKFAPITSLDHKLEFELLSQFVERLRVELNRTLPSGVWTMMARALYLSPIKSELRFLVHVSSTTRYFDLERAESVTVFYRYCVFDVLFNNYEEKIEWISYNAAPNIGQNIFKKIVLRFARRGIRIVRKLFRKLIRVVHRASRIVLKALGIIRP